jgi:hypothetical protein
MMLRRAHTILFAAAMCTVLMQPAHAQPAAPATACASCGNTGLCGEVIPETESGGLCANEACAQSSGPVEDSHCRRLCPLQQNSLVARILNKLDIDRDGVADLSPDSDGDGLPDNWELGGFEGPEVDTPAKCKEKDRLVRFPAPSPMVPGTPPTPIFTRLAVATSALDYDTDHDGLSDFIEVFGLKFIDENGNGRLDPDEWADLNGDGMPSPGEWPLDNSVEIETADLCCELLHDFDGFVFTDPTNPDTDGDGLLDGEDADPLINPRSFGRSDIIVPTTAAGDDADKDNDGLGNGMDMANDLVAGEPASFDANGNVTARVLRTHQDVDNPLDLPRLILLFRPDLSQSNRMPESLIEDLLGLDWNGNGLWRTTDIRDWTMVIPRSGEPGAPSDEFFKIAGAGPGGGDHFLYVPRSFADVARAYDDPANNNHSFHGEGLGLGWQRLLEPPAPTDFMPDLRVYGVLYAWRVPGFDIDGDGFTGAPTLSATAVYDNVACPTSGKCRTIALTADGELTDAVDSAAPGREPGGGVSSTTEPFDDSEAIAPVPQPARFDGAIEPLPCGNGAAQGMILLMFVGLGCLPRRLARPRVG